MVYIYTTSDSALGCEWCGKPLGNALSVVYLNGNQPICDRCLMQGYPPKIPLVTELTGLESEY